VNKQHSDYKVVPYPKLRRALAVMYRSVRRKPMIHGLIEVDVTRARAFLRDHKAKTGESLSFTAFIITCLAHAIDENKSVHACRKGSKHLVLFDEVDNEDIAIYEYLCMTLSFDHTIIDGAPAARFIQRLKDLIESGYGLCESEVEGHVVTR
jgi:pyruvate/2-oxoglutarate dehydrogenase complex dihydrolipoamide acyltransferase (E2) component